MSQLIAKLTEFRQKASGAFEDVPDTLIGTIIFLTVLTVVALAILMLLGYLATQ